MKNIAFVESPPVAKKARKAFTCPHCGNTGEYLEFRGLDLEYHDIIYPGKDYLIRLKCPSCMQGMRDVKFKVEAD